MTGVPSRRRWAFGAVVLFVAASACGGAAADSGSTTSTTLTVFAAASLNRVFPAIADQFNRAHQDVRVRFSFAGTDALVAQIEQGAPADVFAGASAKYGEELSTKGLVEAPRPFATNRLVFVLPPGNPAGIGSLQDLARPGIKLVIGAETVPVGSYTRKVLANLDALYGPTYSRAVLENVVSNEDNVEGVLTKVRLGEADAGFVYVTDSKAVGAAVKTVQLPPEAQAIATYPIAVIRSRPHLRLARLFEEFVLGSTGQRLLENAGFGPPTAA